MNTKYHFDDSHSQNKKELRDGNDPNTNKLTGAKNMLKRDRFELLSAYLDGEVTAAERRQVEEWLSNDPSARNLHTRLLSLRQGLRNLPIPQSEKSIEETVDSVMARLRRRSRIWVLGGAAVAACLIGSLSTLIPGGEPGFRVANQSSEKAQDSSSAEIASLPMVALNKPLMPIPKANQSLSQESGKYN
ncbi:anti-sigma factor family protein [Rivularia sp. UHCC 0363]|uniref:anti-sigma factor family protein n=1 Tax=Rivularia sp. UHCC 0363 TaxID=3110244 RepID=UPI002B22004E|nr:zf-HC2 domain-containing protein [Rivularia sp. UHCC 0363]MEA5599164.1 zf-HC2 domain-containing protein [Rivularia sp. UHCC 0363]